MDKDTPETSARAAVDAIADGNRAAAVDAINNLMYGKSAEVLDTYSDTIAKSYFGDSSWTLIHFIKKRFMIITATIIQLATIQQPIA